MRFEIENRNYYFDSDLYFKVLAYNPGTIDFLSENPFAHIHDGKLIASLTCPFMESGIVDEIVSKQRKALTRGIERYEYAVMQDLSDEERERIQKGCDEFHEKGTIVLKRVQPTSSVI